MHDFTLIVTDGCAPPDLHAEALSSLDRLPAAELIRARGTTLAVTTDWWEAVFAVADLGTMGLIGPGSIDNGSSGLAVAEIAWYGVSGRRANNFWLATPVRLTAAIDHVRLERVGAPRSTPVESLIEDFNREFSHDRLVLYRAAGRDWFLELPRSLSATSVDPGRTVGSDVADSFPAGPDGSYLRRLMTEIQMWFHNRSDEQAACNALWLWGGGGVWPDVSGRSLPVAASSEPLLRGLWRLGAGENREPVENFQAADQLDAGRLLVTLSLEEWRAAGQERPLQRLERDWLAPAWNALTSGTLKTLNLNLNGALTRVTRGQHWRVWRKIRHWAES